MAQTQNPASTGGISDRTSKRRITVEGEFPNRKRWTRQECRRLVKMGFLVGRYELVDGEIISKMGQNPPHSVTVALVMAWLVRHFDPLLVRIQSPIDVAPDDNEENEPEPDAVLLNRPVTDFLTAQPGPGDISLVIEVADTTVRLDRNNKRIRYARAGIAEYWVVDVNARSLWTYRGPQADGTYTQEAERAEAETVSPLTHPGVSVRVGELLPPQ